MNNTLFIATDFNVNEVAKHWEDSMKEFYKFTKEAVVVALDKLQDLEEDEYYAKLLVIKIPYTTIMNDYRITTLLTCLEERSNLSPTLVLFDSVQAKRLKQLDELKVKFVNTGWEFRIEGRRK